MRAAAIALLGALAACSAQARTPAPAAAPHGTAYVDVSRLLRAHPLYGALSDYDRQIAALRATQGAAGLESAPAQSRAASVRALHEASAAAATDAYVASASAADRMREAGAMDEGALRGRIAASFQRQIAVVRGGAASAQSRYAATVGAHRRSATANLASSLAQRVNRAYQARAQRLREAEINAVAARESAVAARQLHARIALTIATSAKQRQRSRAELADIASSLARAASARASADAATLSAYRALLQASASNEAAHASEQLRRDAAVNDRIHAQVTQAQLQGPSSLPAPPGGAEFTAAMKTAAASLGSARSTPAFTSTGTAIAQQLAAIGDRDAAATTGVATEIRTLERERAGLYARIVASIRRDAQAVASARGLRYVSTPGKGAIDLTAAVGKKIASTLGQ